MAPQTYEPSGPINAPSSIKLLHFLPSLHFVLWGSAWRCGRTNRAGECAPAAGSTAGNSSEPSPWERTMFPWRVSIAVLLGLAWCFSDSVRAVAHYLLCFLLCFSAPLLLTSSGRDGSTQTDEEPKESPLQVIKTSPLRTKARLSDPKTRRSSGQMYVCSTVAFNRCWAF